jgi:cell division protein FtsB
MVVEIMGDEERHSRWGFRGKTVWDWLPILGTFAIPLVIFAGTWWITSQQGKIEDQRAQAEREIEEQRAQDTALQAYLAQMSQLMLQEDLRSSEEGDTIFAIAHARTTAMIKKRQRPTRLSYKIFYVLHERRPCAGG